MECNELFKEMKILLKLSKAIITSGKSFARHLPKIAQPFKPGVSVREERHKNGLGQLQENPPLKKWENELTR